MRSSGWSYPVSMIYRRNPVARWHKLDKQGKRWSRIGVRGFPTYRVFQVRRDDHLKNPWWLGYWTFEVFQQHELVQGVVPDIEGQLNTSGLTGTGPELLTTALGRLHRAGPRKGTCSHCKGSCLLRICCTLSCQVPEIETHNPVIVISICFNKAVKCNQ